ncbi:FecR domain-containing protein [Marinobacter xestospongiae]|uniref:FecR domain-containing protein n=1 Tax=Marinobacter xestospongiae TaxID=994319 RepID=A0ABU3VZ98_9GAMM|nr:FecR domain-containing protein [Marinobacter xestospongiae]MDV2079486.1 FecR domain-containing protein [Marinobacter xestospongiae]
MPDSELPPHDVLRQAAHWFATLTDEPVSEKDRCAWQAWFQASPENQQAWQYVEQVGQRFHQARQQVGTTDAGQIVTRTRNHRLSRRRVLGGGIACATLGLLSQTPAARTTHRWAVALTADHHTGIGEQQHLSLQDHSQLWLNTATAVDVEYRQQRRTISLRQGEILVQTAPDKQGRPFIVTTNAGTLRALGTRFAVHQGDHQVRVDVFEGAVEIRTVDGLSETIPAGWQTSFSNRQISPLGETNDAREAWRNGLIIAINTPLTTLVTELARYRHGHLEVAPSLEHLTVTGTFPIHKPDLALTMLENTLPIRVLHLLPWWVSLEPR